jgi:hypothetical protein
MKHVDEAPLPVEAERTPAAGVPSPVPPDVSAESEGVDEVLYAGMRTAAAVYRRRRKRL